MGRSRCFSEEPSPARWQAIDTRTDKPKLARGGKEDVGFGRESSLGLVERRSMALRTLRKSLRTVLGSPRVRSTTAQTRDLAPELAATVVSRVVVWLGWSKAAREARSR